MKTGKWIFGAAIAIAMLRVAAAHTVWIEPLDEKMVIRFAEPGSKFEKSPGHLDSLSAPITFKVLTNAPVALASSKEADHFEVADAAQNEVICTESIFTVRAKRKPYFYARWHPLSAGAGVPLLTLDLVPTGTRGEVRAHFRGKPLGGVKATLRSPDEKETELTADEAGILRFEPTAPGRYLLTIAHHREESIGFHLGRPYEQASHNTALTWIQP
jgi:hypothetical protein